VVESRNGINWYREYPLEKQRVGDEFGSCLKPVDFSASPEFPAVFVRISTWPGHTCMISRCASFDGCIDSHVNRTSGSIPHHPALKSWCDTHFGSPYRRQSPMP
jgi:hypothetical protein